MRKILAIAGIALLVLVSAACSGRREPGFAYRGDPPIPTASATVTPGTPGPRPSVSPTPTSTITVTREPQPSAVPTAPLVCTRSTCVPAGSQ